MGLIMGNGRVEVMRDVSGANFVMEKVNGTPWIEFVVRTIDRMEGAPHEVVVIVGEVRDVNVSVLEPK